MITLVIIGVVAAMTMPIMVADWQKQATISRLKKVYSTMQNALNLSVTMNGPFNDWGSEVAEGDLDRYGYTEIDLIKEYYLPYLNVVHICESEDDDFCNYTVNHYGYKTKLPLSEDNPAFVLSDGTIVFYAWYYASIGHRLDYIYFYIDINGAKKPNKTGRDIFMGRMRITQNTTDFDFFEKEGVSREEFLQTCKLQIAGCAALIITDGWQIKDDYPW